MGIRTFVAAAILPLTALAGTLTIDNACTFDIFVLPEAGAASIQVPSYTNTTLPLAGSGVNVELDVTDTFSTPMAFDYSITDLIYYDLNTINSDPFEAEGFSLIPSDPTCHAINCPGGANDCSDVYNPSGNTAVWACQPDADILITTC